MKGVHSAIVLVGCWSVLLLGSCNSLRLPLLGNETSRPPISQGVADLHGVELLLQYYYDLKSLPKNELQRELYYARQVVAKEPTRLERMRLILLLSLPEESIRDREQAQALLQEFLKRKNTGNRESLYHLALLLQAFFGESVHQRRRYRLLKEELKQKERKIKRLRIGLEYLDGQHEQEQEWAASLEKQLKIERGRVEALEQQLEAIKTIEKQLEHRSQPKETVTLPEQNKVLDE